MRFVTLRHEGRTRAGVLRGNLGDAEAFVVDLAHPEISDLLDGAQPTLPALIEADLQAVCGRLSATEEPAAARIACADIEVLAPLPCPRRIIGIAHNYRCALAERGMELPSQPVVFEKHPSTVIAPGDTVHLAPGIGGVTYEAELAAVIGLRADSVPPENALAHVAGYTIFNDVSASEIIRADGGFERGKNFATFGPMGPCLVTPDEVGDPKNLGVSLEVDGEVLQSGSTADMLFGVAELVSILSRERPLEVGDVIATGTPAGVAPLRSPPTWLRSGSIVSVTIDTLGTLSNPVADEVLVHA